MLFYRTLEKVLWVRHMSEDMQQLYRSKRDYFVGRAREIVGNRPDAEDAVHNAFVSALYMNGGYRAGRMQDLVDTQSRLLVERRMKRQLLMGTVLTDPTSVDIVDEDGSKQ